jgi:hypothetical protein
VKSRLQVIFLDHYHNDPCEWQDFHECAHFLLAGMAAESSVSTVTQACVPTIFTIPLAFSTLPPAAIVVKTEDTASILQDTLRRMENMFASVLYQNMHGGAPAAYALLQQYAAPPPQQYSALPLQSYTISTVPNSAGPRPEQKCHFLRWSGTAQAQQTTSTTAFANEIPNCPQQQWLDSALDHGS